MHAGSYVVVVALNNFQYRDGTRLRANSLDTVLLSVVKEMVPGCMPKSMLPCSSLPPMPGCALTPPGVTTRDACAFDLEIDGVSHYSHHYGTVSCPPWLRPRSLRSR
jgi:hypothetical protein